MHLAQYCSLWVDGIHFNLRHDEGRLCVLVVMGATEDGINQFVTTKSSGMNRSS